MTIVLDSGGVSALSGALPRLRVLQREGRWPPLVPSVVLAECLTGDHWRDHHANRLLRLCNVADVDEHLARRAAVLRTAAARRRPSATDAIVMAAAVEAEAEVVLTSDPADLRALAAVAGHRVRVEPV